MSTVGSERPIMRGIEATVRRGLVRAPKSPSSVPGWKARQKRGLSELSWLATF